MPWAVTLDGPAQPRRQSPAYMCSTGTPSVSRALEAQSVWKVSSTAWGSVTTTTSEAPRRVTSSRRVGRGSSPVISPVATTACASSSARVVARAVFASACASVRSTGFRTSSGLSASSVSTMIAGAGPPSTCSAWPEVPACPLWSVGSLDSLGAAVRSSRSGAVGTSAVGSVMSPPYRGAPSSRNAAGPAPPRGSRPSGIRQVRSELVETESLVVQTDGLARARTEACVVVGVVARQRVHRGLGLLGGLDLDVPVAGQARAGRDELSEDDVLLEAEQRVGLGLHGGLREHAGRLL